VRCTVVSGGVSPELLARLAADDRVPAWLELEQDPVFAHLTPGQRRWYVERALGIGREQAAMVAGQAPGGVAEQLGAKVRVVDRESRFAGVEVRAEHDSETGVITLYAPSVRQVADLLSQVLPEPWSLEQVEGLHVAHELFHHLEATRIGPVHEQLPPVVTFRLGRVWQTRSRARRCREIAAHAFARTLMDLPFLPNAVDWLVLIATGKWSEQALVGALERAEAGLQVSPEE
jgi:hypothetical protein